MIEINLFYFFFKLDSYRGIINGPRFTLNPESMIVQLMTSLSKPVYFSSIQSYFSAKLWSRIPLLNSVFVLALFSHNISLLSEQPSSCRERSEIWSRGQKTILTVWTVRLERESRVGRTTLARPNSAQIPDYP